MVSLRQEGVERALLAALGITHRRHLRGEGVNERACCRRVSSYGRYVVAESALFCSARRRPPPPPEKMEVGRGKDAGEDGQGLDKCKRWA